VTTEEFSKILNNLAARAANPSAGASIPDGVTALEQLRLAREAWEKILATPDASNFLKEDWERKAAYWLRRANETLARYGF
jgi:hypothetical protein